jgi:hypothetical protein
VLTQNSHWFAGYRLASSCVLASCWLASKHLGVSKTYSALVVGEEDSYFTETLKGTDIIIVRSSVLNFAICWFDILCPPKTVKMESNKISFSLAFVTLRTHLWDE